MNNKFCYTLIFLFIHLQFLFASSSEQKVEVQPRQVMLYLRGAKVKSTATVHLNKGRNVVVMTQLPYCIDDNSYKIGVNKDCSLFSFSPRMKKQKEAVINKKYSQKTIDSVMAELDAKIAVNQTRINLLSEKTRNVKDILSTNRDLLKNPSTQKDMGKYDDHLVNNLKGMIDIYDQKLTQYNEETIKLNNENQFIQKEKIRWQTIFYSTPEQTIEEQTVDLLTKELVVEVYSPTEQTSQISVDYFVSNASWIPSYDIKVDQVTKPLELVYKGKIFQYTGQNWDNVKLTVSAFLPRAYQSRPVLSNLYVNHVIPVPTPSAAMYKEVEKKKDYGSYSNVAITGMEIKSPAVLASTSGNVIQVNMQYDVPTAQMSQELMNVEYVLGSEQTIASSQVGTTVILTSQLAATRNKYYWIPKVSNEVFLIAWFKNWHTYNFLDGEANIFINENYVGKTNISSQITAAEFPISLGVDERIIGKRLEVKGEDNVKKKKDIKSETTNYEYTIRNNTNQDIGIDIYDQFPVSENPKVIIDKLEYSKAEYTPETGRLYWDTKVSKGEILKFKMGYTVTSPIEGNLHYYFK